MTKDLFKAYGCHKELLFSVLQCRNRVHEMYTVVAVQESVQHVMRLKNSLQQDWWMPKDYMDFKT